MFNVGITIGIITLLPSCVCAQSGALGTTTLGEGKIVSAQDSTGVSCIPPGVTVGVIYPIYNIQRTQAAVATADQVALSGCFSTVTLSGTTTSTSSINNPEACFTKCLDWKYATFTPVGASGTYSCTCGTVATTGASATCGVNVPILYNNALAVTGAMSRRRRQAAAIAARNAKNCPASYSECLVNAATPTTLASFECIDTQTELESCGGCVNGVYTGQDTASNITSSGVDCTAIPGVSFGSVSCVRGQCVVSRCRRGYHLIDGTCEADDATLKIQDGSSYFKRLL